MEATKEFFEKLDAFVDQYGGNVIIYIFKYLFYKIIIIIKAHNNCIKWLVEK